MRHKHFVSKALAITALFSMMLFCVSAFAQETTGGIQGTVKDPQGAVISGATVTVTSPALIGTQSATTDSAGTYRIDRLPPGTYELTVNAAGFGPNKQSGIKLDVGALPIINVGMKLGSEATTVDVNSEAPAVDVTQSKVQTNVTREVLDGIPKGRSFQSVIPFAPGARQEPLQSTTGGRNNGFQIDGASDSENVYLIDGINTTNIQNGGVGKNFQTDFIQEVQIKSSSFEAEFGGALGGVINAIPKHGSNNWHGDILGYLQSSAFDANDPCASGFTSSGFSTVCGLRLDPTQAGLSGARRQDGTPQYYVPKPDRRRILEPGFDVGGPLFRDRLWMFASYIPSIDTTRRTTTFTGANPGPRTLTQTTTQHNAYARLDYRMFNSLRLFSSWNYGYARVTGTLGSPDSAIGQLNTGASTDPNTLRSDAGSVNPLSVYGFGGDWTPTSKLVISSRYGYFFNNTEQRGVPVGIREVYQNNVTASNGKVDANGRPLSTTPGNPNFNPCTTDLNGVCFSNDGAAVAALINTAGFANIPSNLATQFDAYKRKSWNSDVSYFVGNFWGSHTFKGGYSWQRQENSVLRTFQTAAVNLTFGDVYSPVTSNTACDAVKQQNVANGLPGNCTGLLGYFVVGTNVVNTGSDSQTANALYFQDSWTVGKTGLTLNLGVRFDQEDQPAYDPTRFPSVHFGFSQKTAPRIGGAYDLLHNGKVKLFASYGQFYDIMKMGLARGSFGSDYWHNCVYALDTPNIAAITPTFPIGGGCPATGPAPGVTVGRFIENVDFRATKADPRDPAVMPNMDPMKQHELVFGVDWAISPNFSLETRYSRKRLDNTIEDMAITDNLGFYIGNPGTTFADVLHRNTVIPCGAQPGFVCVPDAAGNYLNTTPFCAECPAVQRAVRNYDGVEFRLAKRPTGRWFGAISYTYSALRGNYAGLTNSDPTDGGGGRHSPNNGRAFDLPNMAYNADGTPDYGPLATDRPHTASIQGYYRQKWWMGQETVFGFTQAAFQGSPISTCLSVVGTSSACQWIGRGNFANFTRVAGSFNPPNPANPAVGVNAALPICNTCGNFVLSGVTQDARTNPFFQTDFNFTHEVPVSKTHEQMRVKFEANISNLFNQHSEMAVQQIPFASTATLISPLRAARFSGDPQVDWAKVMGGFDYTAEINQESQSPIVDPKGQLAGLTLANRYGLPLVFQTARQMRLSLRFTF